MKRNRITRFFHLIVMLVAIGVGIAKGQDLQPAQNIVGPWTIYAYNVDRPGSSLKTIQVTQQ